MVPRYLERVLPGACGPPLPLLFPLSWQYWRTGDASAVPSVRELAQRAGATLWWLGTCMVGVVSGKRRRGFQPLGADDTADDEEFQPGTVSFPHALSCTCMLTKWTLLGATTSNSWPLSQSWSIRLNCRTIGLAPSNRAITLTHRSAVAFGHLHVTAR